MKPVCLKYLMGLKYILRFYKLLTECVLVYELLENVLWYTIRLFLKNMKDNKKYKPES